MSFNRTVIVGTNDLGQLLGGEQAVGSTTARLPCIHLGSMDSARDASVSKNNGRMRTPVPEAFTCWWWSRIQVCTILLQCQEALSQMSACCSCETQLTNPLLSFFMFALLLKRDSSSCTVHINRHACKRGICWALDNSSCIRGVEFSSMAWT